MGRKIPGKKHKTIKDPYKQKQKRLDSLKFKINNPPSNVNEQEIPKSLLKIMELKVKAKEMKPRKPKWRKQRPVLLSVAKLLDKEPIVKGMTKPDKFIPKLVQKPNESATHFLKRVSSMTQSLINEVEFEKKFGVEINKNPDTGQIVEVKHLKNKKVKSKKRKLSEKRKEKLEVRKESLKDVKDFNQLKDEIHFGEVVHRPPNLPLLKEKERTKTVENKKTKYGNLLLNSLVENRNTTSGPKIEKEKSERERRFIVEAYRKLKKKNS